MIKFAVVCFLGLFLLFPEAVYAQQSGVKALTVTSNPDGTRLHHDAASAGNHDSAEPFQPS